MVEMPMPQPAHALAVPTRAPQDNRVRLVNYQPYNITRIVGTIRSSVQVEFAPDEEIAHVALGNTVAWEVAPAGHILFLKPRENQPSTNISVVTTRRDGSKRSRSEEHTSELQSLMRTSYAVFCLKKKKKTQ